MPKNNSLKNGSLAQVMQSEIMHFAHDTVKETVWKGGGGYNEESRWGPKEGKEGTVW